MLGLLSASRKPGVLADGNKDVTDAVVGSLPSPSAHTLAHQDISKLIAGLRAAVTRVNGAAHRVCKRGTREKHDVRDDFTEIVADNAVEVRREARQDGA